jgi:Mg2+/citrate symporter
MDYLQIIGLILMAPLAVIVVAMNMAKTEARRLRKLKERAERKRWKGMQ